MWRLFRIALMWLLAAAVPLQGMAAVTMVACGLSHHGMAQSGAEDASRAGHGHAHGHAHDGTMPDAADDAHHHPDHSASHLDVGAAHAQVEGSSTDPGASATHDLHKVSQSKCSACASCCASAVLPMAWLAFDSPALAEFFAPPMPCLVAVFMTDGQERPPRAFLA